MLSIPQSKNEFPAISPLKRRYLSAAFFLLGFLFDILTLGRIDDIGTISQHGLFLFVIGALLSLDLMDRAHPFSGSERLQKLWGHRNDLAHFLFGSLLSAYTLFYFKSASVITSFAFLLLMAGLLVANEFSRFQASGPVMRFTLFSLCLSSYFCYLIPIILGSIGLIPFLTALACSLGISFCIYKILKKRLAHDANPLPLPLPLALQDQALPQLPQSKNAGPVHPARLNTVSLRAALGVQVVFLALYISHFIPPVPLSARYIGIYHNIEKKADRYYLYYDRPYWKFWESGAQTFLARPGDRIYVYTRIFSPANFKDEIHVRWLHKDKKQGWRSWDEVPITISGGREEGFRGYSVKQNYTPGRWRVQIETSDGREIGRIHFTIVPDMAGGSGPDDPKNTESSGGRDFGLDIDY